MKLDLGCGEHKTRGLLGVDVIEHKNVDIIHDLSVFPYPFETSSVDYIQANHILEHVPDFIATVEELCRICKDGAVIEVRCPHASCFPTVWADPTHKRALVSNSFIHWGEDSRHIYGFTGELVVDKVRLHFCLYEGERNGKLTTSKPIKIIGKAIDTVVNSSAGMQKVFERLFSAYIGGFEEVYFQLRVVKNN